MLCGDYQIFGKGNVVIDTKQDMQEVYSNVITDHERFANEARLAREAGIRLIILVTDPGVSSIEEVRHWKNPRRERWFMVRAMQRKGKMLTVKQSKTPPCASDRLQKAMVTMTLRYGITWLFCKRENVGAELAAMDTARQERETTDFAASCARAAKMVQAVGDAHALCWWNLL